MRQISAMMLLLVIGVAVASLGEPTITYLVAAGSVELAAVREVGD